MAPKRKVNDSGNSATPKRRREVLSLSDKVTIISAVITGKKSYAEVGCMFNKKEERMF